MNQHKMYRCIKLIQLMQEKSRQISAIARYLNVSDRTVYRYFHLFKALGYQVNKDSYNKYFLNGHNTTS
jgi:predicted DNA-binding transcriptional regulator YafY